MREPEVATAPSPAQSATSRPDALPLVILNPASDSGRAAKLRRTLEKALLGGRGELALTTGPGHATQLAEQAAREGRSVVVVGGDGVIHEAAGGVIASGVSVPFGVVPAGNGNDFALHVANAPRDLAQALDLALNGPIERVDVGVVNGNYFVNAISVGLDANVSFTSEGLKPYWLKGQALYMTAALTELLFHYDRCPTLTVQCDDGPPMRKLFALVAMSIGPTYGGGFWINPNADPQDGLFDVCLFTKPPLLRALRLLPVVEQGKHIGQPEITIVRCSRLTLEADHPVNAQYDGELARASRFEVSLLPGALSLRRGPASTAR